MHKFILAILLIFFTSLPVGSEGEKPYVAVFAPAGYWGCWKDYTPDLYFESKSWANLDYFLQVVKIQSAGRPIVLDIDCHGGAYNGMLSTDREGSDECSSGWLIKHIDKQLHGTNLIVLLEACYARITIEKTLRPGVIVETADLHVDRFEGYPEFPIFGVGRSPNYDNLMYLQYRHNLYNYREDERLYIDCPVDKPDDSKDTDMNLRSLDTLLRLI